MQLTGRQIGDRGVWATLAHRTWSVMAGGVTVFLVSRCLTPVQQGYFYTFGSILAMQVFFELGLGQVVVNLVAHEAVSTDTTYNVPGASDITHAGRINDLKIQLRKWYSAIALLFITVVSAIGVAFYRGGELRTDQWIGPWLCVVSATSYNLAQSWRLSIVEGYGYIYDVSRLRLKQSIIGYVLLWIGLVMKAGLWVTVMLPTAAAVTTTVWLRKDRAAGVAEIPDTHRRAATIVWKRDILPLQWRIAASWISGYFIFQLFTPLTFKNSGSVEAGRLGLALTVFSAIGTIGMSWISARVPTISMMIARGDSLNLLSEFRKATQHSIVFTAVLSSAAVMLFSAAQWIMPDLSARVADVPVLLCIAAATVLNSGIFCAAAFMRAHREEPMLTNSLISAVLIATASLTLSPSGTFAMMSGYVAITAVVAVPWTLYLLKTYIARHTPVP